MTFFVEERSTKQGVREGLNARQCTTMRLDWGTFNSRIPINTTLRWGDGDCSTTDSFGKIKKLDKYKLIKLLWWWNRRELNPRPKTPWHNLLRGHSFYWNSPQGAPNDRLTYWVAILCMTDSMAKDRCMFTTNLTHGGSRSPHPRYGRHYCRVTAYAARATVLLSFIILVGHFNGIILPATLIMPQNPCRNLCGPIGVWSVRHIL